MDYYNTKESNFQALTGGQEDSEWPNCHVSYEQKLLQNYRVNVIIIFQYPLKINSAMTIMSKGYTKSCFNYAPSYIAEIKDKWRYTSFPLHPFKGCTGRILHVYLL
jgi:hypothetical protein